MKTLLRILIIGAILLILIFLSIGIVKVVPKTLSSLASASVSISSLFGGEATSTVATSTPTDSGFIIATSTPAATSTSRSLKDILMPHINDFPVNNYVPTPAKRSTLSAGNVYRTSNAIAPHVCGANEYPDLAVSVLSRGIIDRNSGSFVPTNSFTTGDTASIKFKIENRGTCSTGTWNLSTQLPSSNPTDRTRNVTNVGSLPPGSAVTGVANFDSPTVGTAVATFTVTDNTGRDSNTSNNTASVTLQVANGGTIGGGTIGTIGDGRPDLTVQVLRTGILDANNNFIATNNNVYRSTDRVAVQFQVINQGKSATGSWNFQATLSGNFPTKLYNNPQYEASIPAGGSSTYTMAFDNIGYGSNSITIMVDNLNQVNEVNEGNNTAVVSFTANY